MHEKRKVGRPAISDKKVTYAVRLRPYQIKWLHSHSRGFTAKFFDDAINDGI